MQANRMDVTVDSLPSKYENFLIIGDFNTHACDTPVKYLCDIYSFKVYNNWTSML